MPPIFRLAMAKSLEAMAGNLSVGIFASNCWFPLSYFLLSKNSDKIVVKCDEMNSQSTRLLD